MKRKDPIPLNISRKKLAEFWDTHSIADYAEELNPVNVNFAKNLSTGITIRFDPKILALLRGYAKKKGMGPTTLARMWIMERLNAAV